MRRAVLVSFLLASVAACQAPPAPSPKSALPERAGTEVARTTTGAPIPGEAATPPAKPPRDSACARASDSALQALFGGVATPLSDAARSATPNHVCVWMSEDRRAQVSLSVIGPEQFRAAGLADARAQFAASEQIMAALGSKRAVANLGGEAFMFGPEVVESGLVVLSGQTVFVFDAKGVDAQRFEAFARSVAR